MTAFEIIPGKNNGYPFIKGLRDDVTAGLTQPLCRGIFRGKKGEYLTIPFSRNFDAALKAPLPLCMMICFGENVNGGLPWIKRLRAVRKITDSSLYFKDKKAESLYFDNKDIETAYCNNKKVFDKYYVREYIV